MKTVSLTTSRLFLMRRLLSLACIASLAPPLRADEKSELKADLFKGVELDNAQLVRRALAKGIDPNSAGDKGLVPLFVAMRDGSFEAAEVLLAHKDIQADAANDAGETPLMMAALRGHTNWVTRLINRGAAINRQGWTPLHYAASGPEPKLLSLLLERGAALEAASPNGTTPLMMAAGYGAIDGAVLLLSRGADARRRNNAGLSAVDFARRAGREALVQRLEQAVR
jgi:uncharacterized protein